MLLKPMKIGNLFTEYGWGYPSQLSGALYVALGLGIGRQAFLSTIHCSLFPVPCSLFPVPCSLFPVHCPLSTRIDPCSPASSNRPAPSSASRTQAAFAVLPSKRPASPAASAQRSEE